MSLDPDLRDELHLLHRRLDRLERRAERSHTLLWLLIPITLFTLAFSIPTLVWIVIAIAVALVAGRLVWLYLHPADPADRGGTSGGIPGSEP